MITLIRWYLMKAKEIKLKLALYSAIEQGMNEIVNNKEDIEKKIVHALAEVIHNSSGAATKEEIPKTK